MFSKVKPFRSKKYRDWVKTLPCCQCLNSPCDAHHITGLGSGMGTKNSDATCIPLCREHHTLLHSGNLEINEYYHMAKTIQLATDKGVLSVS